VLALESNQQARPVEGVPGALRVGPAINVDKSLVVHPVALAFVPSKIAVTSVDVCAAGLTGQPDDRLVGQMKERPPAASWMMVNVRLWPAFALSSVEPVTVVLPSVRLKALHWEASKTGVADKVTVQRGELNALFAEREPSVFCERLLPAAVPLLL
jgi:hypothetical protein